MVSHCDEVQYDCIANYGLSSIGMVLKMNKYRVHYAKGTLGGLGPKQGKRTVKARDEQEAKAKVRYLVPGSFSHWVDHLS